MQNNRNQQFLQSIQNNLTTTILHHYQVYTKSVSSLSKLTIYTKDNFRQNTAKFISAYKFCAFTLCAEIAIAITITITIDLSRKLRTFRIQDYPLAVARDIAKNLHNHERSVQLGRQSANSVINRTEYSINNALILIFNVKFKKKS